MHKQLAALCFSFLLNRTFFIKSNFYFSRSFQAALQNPLSILSFKLFPIGHDHCDYNSFFCCCCCRKEILTYFRNMKEEAGREERDNDKNVKPIQRNTNIRGLLKSPGLVERWMKQLPLDTGQRHEIYVQMEVIYAQLLHKGSLFIANK